jgi:OmpA-like transmembrane domain
VPWLATARLRLGYAYDRIQYYATGGAGYVQFTSPITNVAVSASTSSRRTAWVAGVGSESAATPNLILRFEVLYLQLLANTDTAAVAAPVTLTECMYDILLRIGLSYKFGCPTSCNLSPQLMRLSQPFVNWFDRSGPSACQACGTMSVDQPRRCGGIFFFVSSADQSRKVRRVPYSAIRLCKRTIKISNLRPNGA